MNDYPFSQAHFEAATGRQAVLTKPAGSLGFLEQVATQMAGFQHLEAPQARPCSAFLFAADHPVTKHGISPFPAEVTQAMVANFQTGGAAASVLARAAKVPLHVIDVGVFGGRDSELPAGDIRYEDAMSEAVFAECLKRGARAVEHQARGDKVIILGEMGIGNTTVAAGLAAWALEETDPTRLVGAGTGATGQLLETKRQVVRDVSERLRHETRATEALRRAGGRELTALYGAMRAALAQGSVLLIDGFIVTTVAALLVWEEPSAKKGMIFAHRSDEHGHAALLARLEARPLLDLGMRLGEASGALAAYALVERACLLHNEMATFQSAAVPTVES